MQTKQQELKQLNEQIAERKKYLQSIERQIEEVTEAGNNTLFNLSGEIDKAEKELAKVLRRSYEIDQRNRERSIA